MLGRYVCRLVFVVTLVMTAYAQPAYAHPSRQQTDLAALHDFKLTNDFLKKWEAYSSDASRQPCKLSITAALADTDKPTQSLTAAAAALDAKPALHAALKRHGLNAREALLGMMTLMNAAVETMRQQNPKFAQLGHYQQKKVSAANLAFYRRHAQQLHRHQRKIAIAAYHGNGDKLVACTKASD